MGYALKRRRGMTQNLDRLLKPATLAVIGASADVSKIGGRFINSFLSTGFTGKLYPIHLKAKEIMGLKAYPSVLEVPDEIDLALLTIPAGAVEGAIEQCARKGVKFAVIHGTGFSEIGAQGRDLENRVLQIAAKGGVRLVGPNCMGLFGPHVKMNTIVSRYDLPLDPGPVGFFGQSGWVCENTVLWGSQRGLRFSGAISAGNQADLTILDYLDYFGRDPETLVIGAYQEGIKDGQKLFEKARSVTRRKPVVIWKSGRSEAGARAVASHTASMAGSSRVTDAALKQAGIVKAGSIEELHDFMIAFCAPYLPQGKRVGILVESGGGGAAAADACEPLGLEVPTIPEEVQREFTDFTRGKIPPAVGTSNPVDIAWAPAQGTREFWLGCMKILEKTVDVLMVIQYHDMKDEEFIKGVVALMHRTQKPIVLLPGHPTTQADGMAECVRQGIPVYPTPERAVKAILAMTEYAGYVKGLSA
jgi:acyl-CoA synthetase (NDP forming)